MADPSAVQAGVHGAPLGTGVIRKHPADFVVDERLPFAPGEEGAHWYLQVEKTGATTPWAAETLARTLKVAARDVGYAGLKDRHAVTRQWFSVPVLPGKPEPQLGPLADGLQVLAVHRDARKLRRGVHQRNRFALVVRAVDADATALQARLSIIAQQGFSNYFGPQRFGRNGGNLRLADRLAAGQRLGRREREFALSAARAAIFNRLLAQRIARGEFLRLTPGDRAQLDGSRSHFAVEAEDAGLAERIASADIHPTATLWGAQGSLLAAPAADAERAIAADFSNWLGMLEQGRSDSALRPTRAMAYGLEGHVDAAAATLSLAFELAPGSYATALLAEILETTDASHA